MKLKFRHPVPDAPGKKLNHILQYVSENHGMDNPTCMPSDSEVSFVLFLSFSFPPLTITIFMIARLDYANNGRPLAISLGRSK